MTTFFTADLHFHCPGIAKSRGFNDYEKHDQTVLDAINDCVGKNDRLWILGDFGRGSYRDKINCKVIHFLYGNHDKRIGNRFTSCSDTHLEKIHGVHIFLSHYPQAYWDRSHYGSLNLYGHCHAQREDTLDSIWPERRAMDIGIDNAARLSGDLMPFAWSYIEDRLRGRAGHDPVNWYKENFGGF